MLQRAARFSLRFRGVRSETIPTSLGPSHVLSAQGTGTHPPIVFLHGFGSAAAPYAPVFMRMRSRTKHVYAPELPAHGLSGPAHKDLTTDALRIAAGELFDKLVPEPFVLVGNSMGGALALMYAIQRPERVRALVLLSPAAARVPDKDWQQVRSYFVLDTDRDVHRFAERVYHRVPWFLPYFPPLLRDLRHELTRPELQKLLDQVDVNDAPSAEQLARLTMPILLVWGRSDHLLPESALAWFRDHLPPHARILQPEGWGHCPHIDDPAGLARELSRFLDETL
jgi:pimeloyl-ACP methyl ester carboxylesterase